MTKTQGISGADAIKVLARRFPQLYVTPAEGAEQAHRMAAGRGIAPEGATLDHFATSDEDELRMVDTPAGPVEVLFLKNREDFETLLRIVGHRSQPVEIARTIGAITYFGIADWQKVADARNAYVAGGGTDWPCEFARLAKQPGAFRSQIVVISDGPYSNIDSGDTPYEEAEWLRVSREVRLHHECAHVVCRRVMPDDVLPVWDEVTADVVGLLCATEGYDAGLAALFLGVTDEGYAGGRLIEYLDEDQAENVDAMAREVYAACLQVADMVGEEQINAPFDFLLSLKKNPLIRC